MEPFFLNYKIAIWGLGLMGGSLALALRGRCSMLLGVDRDPATLELARQMNIVDRCSDDPAQLLPLSDLVILALPVRSILAALGDLPQLHPGAALVLDLGSTKAEIVAAMKKLPARFEPLGGHPMCGKEQSSLFYAEAGLYQGAAFIFTPVESTTQRARQVAQDLATGIGSVPLWLDAHQHDLWVASTSHLPYLAANALAAVTSPEAASLVGSGFRSTTRLSPSSLPMMLDIIMTNQENIMQNLSAYQQQLSLLSTLISAGDEDELGKVLTAGAENYHKLVNGSS
ncbi:MAG TPA: prephenate dehydrogenase [Anaerolineales bacterium]|nr:prephenate dehydrogenase [Anaerolineales bacterium]